VQLGFLRTRVGRRFLVSNLLAALLPLTVVAVVPYRYVRAELRDMAEARVSRLSKSLAFSTLSALATASHDAGNDLRREGDAIEPAFTSTAFARRDAAEGVPLEIDDSTRVRALTSAETEHLRSGRPLLVLTGDGDDARVLLARALLPWGRPSMPTAWARVSPAILWTGIEEAIAGEEASYCVFEVRSLTRVHCSPELAGEEVALARSRAAVNDLGDRSATLEGERFVATRDVFLRHEFGAREWRVVVLQPTAISYATLDKFVRVSRLLVIGVLVLVFLVSHYQLRRTTEPLARLQEGTQRLQAGDFGTPVVVGTTDEFSDVARSFNAMAHTLDRQLVLLRNLDAIDESALSTRNTHQVVEEALRRFCKLPGCTRVAVAVATGARTVTLDVTTLDLSAPLARTTRLTPSDAELAELLAHPRQLECPPGAARPSYLAAWRSIAIEGGTLLLPLVHNEELLGVIALGLPATITSQRQTIDDARRMADRVALALAQVRLVDRLDALSAGTITAFARAIDANSPWTAGHSERVTRVAVGIGRQMQLSAAELDTLQRGALLHDIGKIAVPPAILDKAGPLTDDEWVVMQRHPVVGCEILAPIQAQADTLPLVRWHHERMDGTGYPDRLAGDAIPPLVRVLAVADVFDALSSQRPYRAGLSLPAACEIIRRSSGSHLDPRVVLAFLDLVRAGGVVPDATTLESSSLAASVARAREPHPSLL
jgi:HD-GYP domain-containing protein (c-di-GMP phosphodiesterase class II)/HAMP domain-containing protein